MCYHDVANHENKKTEIKHCSNLQSIMSDVKLILNESINQSSASFVSGMIFFFFAYVLVSHAKRSTISKCSHKMVHLICKVYAKNAWDGAKKKLINWC